MITDFQYRQMLAATERNSGRVPQSDSEPVEQEAPLHQDIIDLCNRKGWAFVHSRMDKPTRQDKGTLDFAIALDCGRTVWIEAKARGNKPTTEQLGRIVHLKKLGHSAAVCWNMADVLSAIAMARGLAAPAEPLQQSAEQPQRAD